MLQINEVTFFSGYATAFGAANQGQTNGISFLLKKVANDNTCWMSIQHFAYGLATFKWETGNTFQPVTERGPKTYFNKYEPGTVIGKRLGNTQVGDGYLFRGRGYVQVTGRSNYLKDGGLLSIDLITNPDLALEPDTAYRIASVGMRDGWFTGRKLNQYIVAGAAPNYIEARQIINGSDHAAEIAALAQTFENILKTSQVVPAAAVA